MNGTVFKRGGRWVLQIELPPEDGRRRRDYHSFNTRKEAEAARIEQLGRLARGEYVGPTKETVGEFLTGWLAAQESKLRPSTFASYGGLLETHIRPGIGDVRLQALTPARVNKFYGELLKKDRNDGTGLLSTKTVRNVHAVLRKALGDAVRWGSIPRNVAEYADPPKVQASAQREMKAWTAEELRTFLEHVADDRLYAAWHLTAMTGMRRGEVLGLRWSDVDLEGASLAVRRVLLSVNYKLVEGPPKTSRSRRTIALPKETIAALRTWRKTQLQERLAWGEGYEASDLVFTRENGAPIHPDRLSQMFDDHVETASLRRIRFHDLRHTYASIALKAGVPVKVVSERLGHSTTSFTMDIYSHVLPGMQEDAAEKVAGLIFGSA